MRPAEHDRHMVRELRVAVLQVRDHLIRCPVGMGEHPLAHLLLSGVQVDVVQVAVPHQVPPSAGPGPALAVCPLEMAVPDGWPGRGGRSIGYITASGRTRGPPLSA